MSRAPRTQRTARRNLMVPQSTLSDVFSGIVLNFSRPYLPGIWISIVTPRRAAVAAESSPMHYY